MFQKNHIFSYSILFSILFPSSILANKYSSSLKDAFCIDYAKNKSNFTYSQSFYGYQIHYEYCISNVDQLIWDRDNAYKVEQEKKRQAEIRKKNYRQGRKEYLINELENLFE